MSYTIDIDHKNKVVINKHTGDVSMEELEDVWKHLLSMQEFTENGYNLLTDYTDAKFTFSQEALKPIDGFLDSLNHIISGKRNAVIVNNPAEYTLSFLVGSESAKRNNFYVELFSTIEAAYEFLR